MTPLRPRQRPLPLLAAATVGLTALLPAQVDWVQVPIPAAQTPPPRNAGKLIHSAHCGCLILYSGWSNRQRLTDMWRFDGITWTLLDANAPPGMRWGHGMSHDTRTGNLLLFGGARGSYINDTWEWDGSSWTQLQPANSPPPRASVELAYDEARNVHVLFGGDDFRGSYDETWEFAGGNWTQRRFAVRPPARREFDMVYDRGRQRIVLFGGQRDHGNLLGDTWEYDGNAWVQRFPGTSPAPRSTHAMVYDEARARVVLYGGYHDPWTPNSAPLRETWEWDGNDWLQRTTTTNHATPFQLAMAYNPVSRVTVAFGGMTTETWFYYPLHAARAARMSRGCASGSTGVVPTLDPTPRPGNLPWLGEPFELQMDDVPPGGRPVLLLGLDRRSWGGLSLPASLTPLGGGPGCTLDISPAATPAMALSAANTATLALPVPNLQALIGAQLYAQGVVLEPAGSTAALTTTNALDIQVGAR